MPRRPVGALDEDVDGLGRRALRDGGLFFEKEGGQERGEGGKKVRWRSRAERDSIGAARKKKARRSSQLLPFPGKSLRFSPLFFEIIWRLLDATSCIDEARIEIDRETRRRRTSFEMERKRIELCRLFFSPPAPSHYLDSFRDAEGHGVCEHARVRDSLAQREDFDLPELVRGDFAELVHGVFEGEKKKEEEKKSRRSEEER